MTPADLWADARRHLPDRPVRHAVLLLHGLGSNADDLIALAPELAPALPDTVFISPNAPWPCDMAPFGRQWFSLQNWSPESLWQGVRSAAPALEQMIADVQEEFSLPLSSIALLGFSQGGMMTLHMAPRLPEPLAGAICLSGALVGGDHLTNEVVSRPPILLVHGQMDPVVPYAAMPAAAEMLQRSGLPVETLTCPLLAHGVDGPGLERCATFLHRVLR